MNNIEIKEVVIADEYAMMAGFMRGLHEHEHELYDKTAAWGDIEAAYMRHVITAQQEQEGVCVVGYADGVPAGFIFGYAEDEDDSRIELHKGKELYVSDGYIVPEYRRLGLYRKLNEHLEKVFIERGVQRIVRFTLLNNARMRALLESEGYVVTRLMYEKWV